MCVRARACMCIFAYYILHTLRIGHIKLGREKMAKNIDGLSGGADGGGGGSGGLEDLPSLQSCHHLFSS